MSHLDPDNWKRAEALSRIGKLPADVREDIARVVETAEQFTDWVGSDEGSICVDDVQGTLGCLADEIRGSQANDDPTPSSQGVDTILLDMESFRDLRNELPEEIIRHKFMRGEGIITLPTVEVVYEVKPGVYKIIWYPDTNDIRRVVVHKDFIPAVTHEQNAESLENTRRCVARAYDGEFLRHFYADLMSVTLPPLPPRKDKENAQPCKTQEDNGPDLHRY